MPAETKAKMQAALDHFKTELKSLRSSRAQPSMVENVMVEVYGSQMRLREIATVTAPESRQLLISPFDPQVSDAIVKGIDKANLNIRAVREGGVIRIQIPPMDQAIRQETAKQARKKAEDAKISIREIRRKQNEEVRKQKADGDITEDVMKKTEKTIQELTDQFCKQIEDLCATKEKEVMSV